MTTSGAPAVVAPKGSLALDSDVPALWLNTDGAATWVLVASGVAPALTEILTQSTVWVDADYGNDITGTVDRQDLPYRTIQAAINFVESLGVAKPLIKVRPGRHIGNLVLTDTQVHIQGSGSTPSGTIIVDDNSGSPVVEFRNQLQNISDCQIIAGPISGAPAVVFSGIATLQQTEIINCFLSNSSNVNATVVVTSSGIVLGSYANIDNCTAENRAGEALNQSNGRLRVRDFYIGDRSLEGVNIARGTCLVEDSRFVALGTGLTIGVNGIVQVDTATRWDSINNAGTLTYYETGISPQYVPAVLADWGGTDPIDVATALNRIAAALGPIP